MTGHEDTLRELERQHTIDISKPLKDTLLEVPTQPLVAISNGGDKLTTGLFDCTLPVEVEERKALPDGWPNPVNSCDPRHKSKACSKRRAKARQAKASRRRNRHN